MREWGNIMNAIKSVQDFKEFLKINRDLFYSNAVKADDITEDDEWMQENEWDEIYQKEIVGDGKV